MSSSTKSHRAPVNNDEKRSPEQNRHNKGEDQGDLKSIDESEEAVSVEPQVGKVVENAQNPREGSVHRLSGVKAWSIMDFLCRLYQQVQDTSNRPSTDLGNVLVISCNTAPTSNSENSVLVHKVALGEPNVDSSSPGSETTTVQPMTMTEVTESGETRQTAWPKSHRRQHRRTSRERDTISARAEIYRSSRFCPGHSRIGSSKKYRRGRSRSPRSSSADPPSYDCSSVEQTHSCDHVDGDETSSESSSDEESSADDMPGFRARLLAFIRHFSYHKHLSRSTREYLALDAMKRNKYARLRMRPDEYFHGIVAKEKRANAEKEQQERVKFAEKIRLLEKMEEERMKELEMRLAFIRNMEGEPDDVKRREAEDWARNIWSDEGPCLKCLEKRTRVFHKSYIGGETVQEKRRLQYLTDKEMAEEKGEKHPSVKNKMCFTGKYTCTQHAQSESPEKSKGEQLEEDMEGLPQENEETQQTQGKSTEKGGKSTEKDGKSPSSKGRDSKPRYKEWCRELEKKRQKKKPKDYLLPTPVRPWPCRPGPNETDPRQDWTTDETISPLAQPTAVLLEHSISDKESMSKSVTTHKSEDDGTITPSVAKDQGTNAWRESDRHAKHWEPWRGLNKAIGSKYYQSRSPTKRTNKNAISESRRPRSADAKVVRMKERRLAYEKTLEIRRKLGIADNPRVELKVRPESPKWERERRYYDARHGQVMLKKQNETITKGDPKSWTEVRYTVSAEKITAKSLKTGTAFRHPAKTGDSPKTVISISLGDARQEAPVQKLQSPQTVNSNEEPCKESSFKTAPTSKNATKKIESCTAVAGKDTANSYTEKLLEFQKDVAKTEEPKTLTETQGQPKNETITKDEAKLRQEAQGPSPSGQNEVGETQQPLEKSPILSPNILNNARHMIKSAPHLMGLNILEKLSKIQEHNVETKFQNTEMRGFYEPPTPCPIYINPEKWPLLSKILGDQKGPCQDEEQLSLGDNSEQDKTAAEPSQHRNLDSSSSVFRGDLPPIHAPISRRPKCDRIGGVCDNTRELRLCCPAVPMPRPCTNEYLWVHPNEALSWEYDSRPSFRCSQGQPLPFPCGGVKEGLRLTPSHDWARVARHRPDVWADSEIERTPCYLSSKGDRFYHNRMFHRSLTIKNIVSSWSRSKSTGSRKTRESELESIPPGMKVWTSGSTTPEPPKGKFKTDFPYNPKMSMLYKDCDKLMGPFLDAGDWGSHVDRRYQYRNGADNDFKSQTSANATSKPFVTSGGVFPEFRNQNDKRTDFTRVKQRPFGSDMQTILENDKESCFISGRKSGEANQSMSDSHKFTPRLQHPHQVTECHCPCHQWTSNSNMCLHHHCQGNVAGHCLSPSHETSFYPPCLGHLCHDQGHHIPQYHPFNSSQTNATHTSTFSASDIGHSGWDFSSNFKGQPANSWTDHVLDRSENKWTESTYDRPANRWTDQKYLWKDHKYDKPVNSWKDHTYDRPTNIWRDYTYERPANIWKDHTYDNSVNNWKDHTYDSSVGLNNWKDYTYDSAANRRTGYAYISPARTWTDQGYAKPNPLSGEDGRHGYSWADEPWATKHWRQEMRDASMVNGLGSQESVNKSRWSSWPEELRVSRTLFRAHENAYPNHRRSSSAGRCDSLYSCPHWQPSRSTWSTSHHNDSNINSMYGLRRNRSWTEIQTRPHNVYYLSPGRSDRIDLTALGPSSSAPVTHDHIYTSFKTHPQRSTLTRENSLHNATSSTNWTTTQDSHRPHFQFSQPSLIHQTDSGTKASSMRKSRATSAPPRKKKKLRFHSPPATNHPILSGRSKSSQGSSPERSKSPGGTRKARTNWNKSSNKPRRLMSTDSRNPNKVSYPSQRHSWTAQNQMFENDSNRALSSKREDVTSNQWSPAVQQSRWMSAYKRRSELYNPS